MREAEELQTRFPDAVVCVHGDPNLPLAPWPLPSAEQQTLADVQPCDLPLKASRPQQAIPTGDWSISFVEATNCGRRT